MDNLILAIALLGVGVLGMGWLSWSARSTKTNRKVTVSDGFKSEQDMLLNKQQTAQNPYSPSPNIVAFCRTPSTMMVKEDHNNFYVTYRVGKHNRTETRSQDTA